MMCENAPRNMLSGQEEPEEGRENGEHTLPWNEWTLRSHSIPELPLCNARPLLCHRAKAVSYDWMFMVAGCLLYLCSGMFVSSHDHNIFSLILLVRQIQLGIYVWMSQTSFRLGECRRVCLLDHGGDK
jgi:hypothetical protein